MHLLSSQSSDCDMRCGSSILRVRKSESWDIADVFPAPFQNIDFSWIHVGNLRIKLI